MAWEPSLNDMLAQQRQDAYRHEVEQHRQIKGLPARPGHAAGPRRAAGRALIRAGSWLAGPAPEPRRALPASR